MSLADIYTKTYGQEGDGQKKVASEDKAAFEKAWDQFSKEDQEKLAAASGMLDSFGVEFETDLDKLAACGNLVDHLSQEDGEGDGEGDGDSEAEKIAEEYDAAGRIMARGYLDEIQKLASADETDESSFASRIAAAAGK